ncbi:MAG: hypothetical protein P4L22_07165 [Candidatus Babeliales bacterium]|nr:hypothetical protein [Candidatus Babeliales bacterium]
MELKKNIIPISTGFLLAILFSITVGVLLYYSPQYVDNLIVRDIAKLESIFKNIGQDCIILNFEHDKNYIDFLNVEKFVGNEVGSIILEHPNKWQGPYAPFNPRVQDKLYQIVQGSKGYYIVPGDGVRLSNGKVIGRDLLFTSSTNVENMLKDKKALLSKGGPLGAKVNVVMHGRQMAIDEKALDDANIGD